jgi:hypothetical protein
LRKVVAEEIEAALMSLSEEPRTVVLQSRLARARAALRRRLRDYAR